MFSVHAFKLVLIVHLTQHPTMFPIVPSRKGDLRDYGREKILTIVGFALFLAVCASTLIYVLISANAAKDSVRDRCTKLEHS